MDKTDKIAVVFDAGSQRFTMVCFNDHKKSNYILYMPLEVYEANYIKSSYVILFLWEK